MQQVLYLVLCSGVSTIVAVAYRAQPWAALLLVTFVVSSLYYMDT